MAYSSHEFSESHSVLVSLTFFSWKPPNNLVQLTDPLKYYICSSIRDKMEKRKVSTSLLSTTRVLIMADNGWLSNYQGVVTICCVSSKVLAKSSNPVLVTMLNFEILAIFVSIEWIYISGARQGSL